MTAPDSCKCDAWLDAMGGELLDTYPADAMPLPPLFAPRQWPMHASLAGVAL